MCLSHVASIPGNARKEELRGECVTQAAFYRTNYLEWTEQEQADLTKHSTQYVSSNNDQDTVPN